MSELLSCPFCKAELYHQQDETGSFYAHPQPRPREGLACWMVDVIVEDCPDEIASWNARAQQDEPMADPPEHLQAARMPAPWRKLGDDDYPPFGRWHAFWRPGWQKPVIMLFTEEGDEMHDFEEGAEPTYFCEMAAIWDDCDDEDEVAARYQARAQQAKQVVAWQPIETAPKDWTSILLYVPDDDRNEPVIEGYYSCEDGGQDCWLSANNEPCEPTFWIPMPQPPLTAELSTGD